ncbi:hypothetical protein BH09PSE2_BH09PSE2_12590 [soil metagenome]
MSALLQAPADRRTPAWVFLPLLLPFGVSAGYVSVTLAFLLKGAGMAPATIAALVAFSVWPQTWKVFWAPLVDTTLGPKRWHVLGSLGTGLAILALSVVPAGAKTMALLMILIVVSSLASTLVSMSAEVFMAHDVEDERKGDVSGWSQAGNLGGAGLGGGLGLYLSQHAPQPWMGGAALAVLCCACSLALLLVHASPRSRSAPRLVEGLKEVLTDLWSVARSRAGLLVIVLMLLPLGSGGAQGLWAAIAGEWKTDGDTVALVNGVLSGLASLVGAVIAGWLCDRLDRRTAYCLFGLLLGAVAVAMAFGPRSRLVFIIATLGYAFVLGACYAAYSAAVLEAIGKGAAATKFNLLASISNIPIALMTTWDGTAHDRYGANGMLLAEGGVAVASVIFFALFAEATRNRSRPRGWSLRPKPA